MKQLILLLGILSTTSGSALQSSASTRCVIIHHAGPQWNFKLPMTSQNFIFNPASPTDPGTHVGYYLSSGMVALGGPMADPAQKVGDIVGMMVSPPKAGLSDKDCLQLGAGDPAVRAGVLTFDSHLWAPEIGN